MPGPSPDAKRRVMRVTYTVVQDQSKVCIDNVSLTEGYTTEADIPKIIGIYRGLRPEDIIVNRMEEVG